jgi:hypothetical protein
MYSLKYQAWAGERLGLEHILGEQRDYTEKLAAERAAERAKVSFLSSGWCLLAALCSLLSALCSLLSALCSLLSALCSLLSALCSLLSAE